MKSMLVDDLEDIEGIVLCFGLHTIARRDYWFLDCATAFVITKIQPELPTNKQFNAASLGTGTDVFNDG
ncbi:hypothetical protein HZ326_21032 [Fusarium oxysporum f. sp. albedinis]|nr:hypothetical protein HZ326_21032 [Fusarium oxysporum f. sp. albedinis]